MKVNQLDSKTDTLSQKITNTSNALSAEISKNTADTQTLKTTVAANENSIGTIQDQVSKQNVDITSNKKSINTQSQDIAKNKNTIVAQSQDIADNKKSIDKATDNLSMKVNQLDSKTDTLSQKITNTSNALSAEISKNTAETQTLKTTVAANKNLIGTLGDNIKNLKMAPLGTITAWVNRPEIYGQHTENLPTGWMRCDGSLIPSPSPWAGQHVPNINGEERFLRGSADHEMLQTEEDSIQSHTHGVSDPGHNHGYDDKWPDVQDRNSNGYWGPKVGDKLYDRYDKSHSSTTLHSHTSISVTGAQGARIDSETRPKNIKVVYIMRVF